MLHLLNQTTPKTGASVIPQFRAALLHLGLRPDSDCMAKTMTAISEAVANAVKHGGGLITATVSIDHADLILTVEILDGGRGFDFTVPREMPSWDAESGRGILLMQDCVDGVAWEHTDTGFKCILKKQLFRKCANCLERCVFRPLELY